jgi:hypothetical protein
MFYGDSTFERAPEPWKYALYGISLFVYQHLDNLDGKQARKTSKYPINQKIHRLSVCSSIMVAMLSPVCWWDCNSLDLFNVKVYKHPFML